MAVQQEHKHLQVPIRHINRFVERRECSQSPVILDELVPGRIWRQLVGFVRVRIAYPFYTKLTDLANTVIAPGAANTFVFIEERFDCINWGNFQTDMAGYPQPNVAASPSSYEWQLDLPALYHDFASVISFADGHSEIHRWRGDAADTSPASQGNLLGGKGSGDTFPVPYSADVAWMQNVSARPH